jgi:3-oxoacyl-[acyl-carrier-protein] synthase II
MADVDANEIIAVTGMGVVTSLGAAPDTLFRALVQGQRGFSKIRAFDTTGCRVDIAAEAPLPAVNSKPSLVSHGAYTRTAALALHAASAALQQAALPAEARAGAALALGSAGAGTPALEACLERAKRGGSCRGRAAMMLGFPKRFLPDVVGSALGLGGPRATINTACSSGAVSVIHAIELLRARHCDAALAGGADELTRFTLTGFCSLRAVDPEPCRPFDRSRRGMTLGEGAGVLVLERLADVRRRGGRVLAVVAGYGHSCDAGHLTAPDPRGDGASRAMSAALKMAGVEPPDVAFVSAHGTGTPHNDSAEIRAICATLGDHARRCPVHTVKASVGHCMGAAGAVEAIAAISSLIEGLVPPTAGLTDPEFADDADLVRDEARRISGRYGLSNSFGFGGNNAALLLAFPGGMA